jgi:hypothetical protein
MAPTGDRPPRLSPQRPGIDDPQTMGPIYDASCSYDCPGGEAVSIPQVPEPAKVIVSILSAEPNLPEIADRLLTQRLGPLEECVGPLAFDFTSYYDAELGSGIRRWIRVFEYLVDRAELADIKCLTNEIERAYTMDGRRRFNLDPGLMTLGNFVLATGKNNAHRIYLKNGIFADLTLIFRFGSYRPLEWTYPDYADAQLIEILNRIRQGYKCTLEQKAPRTGP